MEHICKLIHVLCEDIYTASTRCRASTSALVLVLLRVCPTPLAPMDATWMPRQQASPARLSPPFSVFAPGPTLHHPACARTKEPF